MDRLARRTARHVRAVGKAAAKDLASAWMGVGNRRLERLKRNRTQRQTEKPRISRCGAFLFVKCGTRSCRWRAAARRYTRRSHKRKGPPQGEPKSLFRTARHQKTSSDLLIQVSSIRDQPGSERLRPSIPVCHPRTLTLMWCSFVSSRLPYFTSSGRMAGACHWTAPPSSAGRFARSDSTGLCRCIRELLAVPG